MAELRVDLPTVTCVLASATACDEVERVVGDDACRAAPREVLIVGGPVGAPARSEVPEPGAVVADVSDGWVLLVLAGRDAAEAFARLSELDLPGSGWTQGEVTRAPAKVRVGDERIDLLVPAHLAAHMEERIRADAAEVLVP